MDYTEFIQLVNLVEHGETSVEIFAKLEPYKVKRAVFLAAGLGSRLAPITINTPKPLVRVHGKRIIDTLIDACLENGIDEIYVVTGYLAEEFTILQHKYPMIKLIHNADFNKANNISSAVVSCHLFENAYVFEADLLVKNPQIIRKYHYCSDVLGIWMDESADWCLIPDGDGYVAEETVGGKNCYQMVGIYYWNKEDAKRLGKDLQETFEKVPGGRNRYWETVPNQLHQGEYKIKIVPCSKTDVIEIDTYEELKQIDSSYT